MKTRKLNKQSLEELAKTMPVLSEEEQRKYVGAERYYDECSGNYLGKAGTNDNILIISAADFYSKNYARGVSIQDRPAIQSSVMRSIAYELGYTGAICTGSLGSNSSGKIRLATANQSTGITVGNDNGFFNEANYYNIKSIIVHEVYHMGDTENTTVQDKELAAYYTQTTHTDYNNTTYAFKNAIQNSMNSYY